MKNYVFNRLEMQYDDISASFHIFNIEKFSKPSGTRKREKI